MERKTAEYGLLEQVVFVGRVNEEEADRYVHFADFAYLSFKNNKIFDMTLPAKLQTYLACGTPILAAAGGESSQMIRNHNCGVVCVPELEKLTEAIDRAIHLPEWERNQMSQAAVECYEKQFAMDHLVDQLVEIMQ